MITSGVEAVKSKKLERSDLLGILASSLCAIHCSLTPLFFLAKPIFFHPTDSHTHGSIYWSALDYVFLVLSLVAVWYSTKHTTHKTIKWILWIAWFLFSAGLISEIFDFKNGIWLMYLGSIILVTGHIINYRHCKKCREESPK